MNKSNITQQKFSTNIDLSVIIPTLNEAQALPKLLTQLNHQQDINLQVIVADGGSTDNTLSLAVEAGAKTVVATPAGRGRQMNKAAKVAQAPWLLFLHADSTLTSPKLLKQALDCMREHHNKSAAAEPKIAGHFTLSFEHSEDREKFAYRYMAAKTHLNRINTTNGDQGFLLTKDFFHTLGGFDETMNFLEDQRLAETIREVGTWVTLPGNLITSARRFETEGLARRYTIMAVIMAAHMTKMHEFFAMAPPLYAAQTDTGKLLVSRYSEIIFPMIRQAKPKPKRQIKQILAYGKYVKDNFWQLFFMLDVRRHKAGEKVQPRWMQRHDRYVQPLVNFKIFDAAVGISIIIWFAMILGCYYRIKDRKELRQLKQKSAI